MDGVSIVTIQSKENVCKVILTAVFRVVMKYCIVLVPKSFPARRNGLMRNVQMLMSAALVCTIATKKPNVPTPMAHTTAIAGEGSLAMGEPHASVLVMNNV